MPDILVNYKDEPLLSINESGTRVLKTKGKYCEDDIEITYVKPHSGGNIIISETDNEAGGKTVEISTVDEIIERQSSDILISGNSITVPDGYYADEIVKNVQIGQEGIPIATKGAVSNNSIAITPSVTNSEGYINGGEKTGAPIIVAVSELVGGTLNINTNGETDVTNYQKVNVNVSGSGKVIQYYSGYARVASTSYTTTAVSLTVEQTGTYKVSWIGFRQSSGGTNGSQLYIGNTAYGSAQTAFTDTYAQKVALSNVNLASGQTITVRARSRSTSYGMFVGNLIIEKTA